MTLPAEWTTYVWLLFAAVLLWFAAKGWRDDVVARSWPTALGRVISSEVKPGGRSYEAHIRYEFRVGAEAFTGERVRMVETSATVPWFARRLTRRFPVGMPIEIAYDPGDPQKSTATCAIGSSLQWSLVMLVPAAIVVLSLWREPTRMG